MGAYNVHLWVLPQVSHLLKVALQVFRRMGKRSQETFDFAVLEPVDSNLAIDVPRIMHWLVDLMRHLNTLG